MRIRVSLTSYLTNPCASPVRAVFDHVSKESRSDAATVVGVSARWAGIRPRVAWMRCAAIAVVAVSFCATGAAAQDAAPAPVQVVNRENQLKAAFLFNFGHYVTWPDDDTATADDPFIIAIAGKHDAVALLKHVAATRKRKGGKGGVERTVEIRQLDPAAAPPPVHILFVPKTVPAAQVKSLVAALAGSATLLVGEDDAFLDNGGMINLGVKDNRMHISVSLPALTDVSLKPDSSLLRITPDVRK